jgi:hypothetical protein
VFGGDQMGKFGGIKCLFGELKKEKKITILQKELRIQNGDITYK